jgi:hypothetical protein
MNAKLEIHRKFSILAWARRVQIWIDGREVAAIANGKTAMMEVPSGTHVIATKLGMMSGRPSTIEFAAGQTARLICKIKMGLSETSFVLYREDGSRLAGDAGPAGHHGPIVMICGLVGFVVGIVGLAALIQGIFDLRKMSSGEMDPSGRTLTIIGIILGAIGFILNVGLIVTMLVLHISPF